MEVECLSLRCLGSTAYLVVVGGEGSGVGRRGLLKGLRCSSVAPKSTETDSPLLAHPDAT